MNDLARQRLLRGALLFALAIIFQGLRLVLPLPPFGGMFLIGALVNLVLVLAVYYAGLLPAITIALLLPVIAFFQGQLPLPLLIPLVAGGNVVFCLLCCLGQGRWMIWLAPLGKVSVLYIGAAALLKWLVIPPKMAAVILLIMSWPQAITAIMGLCLAKLMIKKLPMQKV